MNYLQLANTICLQTDITQITDTESPSNEDNQKRILDYINEVIYELHALDTDWRWGQQELAITLTNATDYTIPSTVNPDTIDVVRIGDTSLQYVNNHVYDINRQKYQVGNGKPFYTIFNNTLILINKPDSALGSSLKITYQLKPVDLVKSSDIPAIPDDYHRVIVKGAEYKIKKFYNWPDALKCEQEYLTWQQNMLKNNKNYGQATYRVELDPGFSIDWSWDFY